MAQTKLTEDLNAVSNSGIEIEYLNGDLNIIQKLDDEPNDVGGMTSAQLKETFDKAGNIIKNYINDTLIPAILSEDATEQARIDAETARANAEVSRVAAEGTRADAEAQRVSAESARTEAESQRASNETSRANAEQQRQTNETSRANAEQQRQTDETARASAEEQRQTDETDRASAEQRRQTNETGRAEAESRRQDAENARVAAENRRQTKETSRETAESARVSAENQRQTAETARAEAEDQRVSAENARSVWEDYDAEKTYVPGNKVAYDGSSYVNITSCTGIAPTDTANSGSPVYWQLIAARGRDGGAATDSMSDRVALLELEARTGVYGNPFIVAFDDLDGITVTGQWNEELARVEF
jgi:chromosome segregation ATPase